MSEKYPIKVEICRIDIQEGLGKLTFEMPHGKWCPQYASGTCDADKRPCSYFVYPKGKKQVKP